MTEKLSLNIFRLLRNRSRCTSIRRLENRGLKHVSVLSFKNLERLIQEAVDNSLAEFGITLTKEELSQVNERTREQFLKVLHDRDQLKESMKNMEAEMGELRNNFHLLKTELAVNSRLLKSEENKPVKEADLIIPGKQLENMESNLVARLNELFAGSEIDESLKQQAVQLTVDLLAEERKKTFDHAKHEQQGRIENLKRRIAKLNTKLEETEALLVRASREGTIEGGIASRFRTTQGLKATESYYEEKRMLLKEIFELNKDLKRLISQG